jgi:hypothetical protein
MAISQTPPALARNDECTHRKLLAQSSTSDVPDVFSEGGMAGLTEKKEKTPLNLRLRSGSATPFTRTRSGYSFYPDGVA